AASPLILRGTGVPGAVGERGAWMRSEADEPGFVLWTASQRRALLVLLLVLGIVLAARRVRDRAELPDPPAAEGPRAAELADRIDPNTADWQTLAAIPTLGEKRARDIVRYRQRCLDKDPKAVAFRTI